MAFRCTSIESIIVPNPKISISLIAAKALATHLIPGCVGRGVRLGSENSSGGAAGAGGGGWKSGNLEIWESGYLETWKSRNWGSKKLEK